MNIRSFRPGDEAAAYLVCLRTGDHGADGTPYYREDPDALGRIYVGPYLKFSPDFALMLEDAEGVCGYALATPDSKEFFARYETEWRPKLVRDFPCPVGDAHKWSRVEEAYHAYHHPRYYYPNEFERYPAHLHIDLMPRAQGAGYGTQMMQELLERLRSENIPGVYLEMSVRNARAFAFYEKLGFHELERNDESIFMAQALANREDR